MYFKKIVKSWFYSLKEVAKLNNKGYYCPNCAIAFNESTVFAYIVYNKPYHKFQVAAKCVECSLTTPAYDKISNVIDNLEDAWVKKEAELFEEED